MMTNFEIRVEFTDNLQRMDDGPIVFIRKQIQNYFDFRRQCCIALKPHSQVKSSRVSEADFSQNIKSKGSVLPDTAADLT